LNDTAGSKLLIPGILKIFLRIDYRVKRLPLFGRPSNRLEVLSRDMVCQPDPVNRLISIIRPVTQVVIQADFFHASRLQPFNGFLRGAYQMPTLRGGSLVIQKNFHEIQGLP
jgi:hypothetical protein